MELEIKHLAPYLPYGLKLQYVVREKVEKTGVLQSISHRDFETHPTRVSIEGLYNEEHIWMFKPILRPLSDLNNEIVINGEKHQMWLLINGQKALENGEIENMNGYQYSILELSYNKIQTILKFHFDIFNLIGQGLAVDINTINHE
jgi:hypothetical protein